ncbi:MAG TPA: hypothetical protein VF466_05315 [Candidatus Saccharimonadales bacterium]
MQPDNSDPTSQNGQTPAGGPTDTSSWQQGLGTNVPASPAPAGGPAPVAPSPDIMPAATPAPAPAAPVVGGVPGMNASMPGPKGGPSKTMLLAIVGIVVVIVLAVAAYFLFLKKDNHQSASNAAQTSANNAEKSAKPLDGYQSATLSAPADMSGFQSDIGTTGVHDYLTTGSDTANGGCELAFGTGNATQLPGNNIDEIVAPGIDSLKKSGVTVNGPQAGTPLTLKDAAGNKYTLPTITYTFAQGSKNAKNAYGVAITKDGNRTFVRWDCAVTGSVDNSKMNQLAQKAAEIMVAVQ